MREIGGLHRQPKDFALYAMETLVTKTQELVAILVILTFVILLSAIKLGWLIAGTFWKPPKLHLRA
jgi:hypothetical protein